MPKLSRSALYRCLKRGELNKIGRTTKCSPLTSGALNGPYWFEITTNEVHGPDGVVIPIFLAVEEITKHVYAEVAYLSCKCGCVSRPFGRRISSKNSTRSTRISGRYSPAVERQPAETSRRSVLTPLQSPAALTGSSIPGRFLLFENPSCRSRLRRRSNPQFDGPLAVRFVPQRGISSSRDTFCVRFVLEAARGRRIGLQRHGSGSKSASAVGDGRRNRLSSGCRAISSFLLAFSKIFDHETAELVGLATERSRTAHPLWPSRQVTIRLFSDSEYIAGQRSGVGVGVIFRKPKRVFVLASI